MASLRRPSQFFPSKEKVKEGDGRPRLPLPGDLGRKRDARKSKVEEKMKSRRMSMRYADDNYGMSSETHGSDFLQRDPYQYTLDVASPIDEEDEFDAHPPPALSSTIFSGSPRKYSSPLATFDELDPLAEDEHEESTQGQHRQRRGTAEGWDFSELNKDGVDLQAYIRKTLIGADEEEKKRFIAALHRQKQATSKDLQKTVFKNYAEFVSISKEISTLENDMLELKELLTEWKTVPQLMGMEDTLAPTLDKDGNIDRHRSRRNSPMNLQQMYRAQMSRLWQTVEGSQKYLPLAPGRHLVFETHNFIELDSATYKAKQNTSLFLLNDLLLVAGRRRTKTSHSGSSKDDHGRMVAERCWVLTDLVVIDLKDSGDLTNALKIKRGKEICVYRATKPEDKKTLLQAFRQVSQELAEKRRKENEAEQERRKTLWQGEGGAGANSRMTRMSTFMGGFGEGGARPLTTIDTSLTDTKDLLWIDEFGDDLTMAIATKDWDEGAKLIERGQDLMRTVSNNVEATEMLKFRIDSLKPSLVNQIAHDLSSPDIRKSSAARLISFLTRLDRAELARDTFLNARHELMVRLVRAIKHEGDISLYINELAVVCFTIVRHTSDWYSNAFKDNRMMSGFVTWAKAQIEYFGNVFRRQVYAPTISQRVVEECQRVTASANRKFLRDAGLDFTFLLEAITERDPDAHRSPTASSSTAASSNPYRQTAAGFRMNMSSPFVPSIPGMQKQSLPSPSGSPGPDLAKGSTQPLSIGRRRPSAAATDLAGGTSSRQLSGTGTPSSGSSTPANAPRPPPRSARRSRPPPARGQEEEFDVHKFDLNQLRG